jgi:DNA-directed RNA polymerase subunit RPC12/RpoP
VKGRDSDGFRIGVSIPTGEDGLWPMRCPQQPRDHVFKVQVSQEQESASAVYCPYCGYREDLWEFAPEQRVLAEAAAMAVAEQQLAAEINDMLRETFGARARPPSSHSGFGIGIDISYRPGPPPPRRTLPTFVAEETRRTMQCERCQEHFAVYRLAIYCPKSRFRSL